MLDFIIIGGGQAGLSMGYFLKKQKKEFLILDKGREIGSSWLNRWDSLRLFTPSEYNDLPGMEFPSEKGHYPTKHEVGDFFKAYVNKYQLPVQLNTLVTAVKKRKNRFIIRYGKKEVETKGVIIATGPFHIPYTPPFHKKIDQKIHQTHSNNYKNPSQLGKGTTLVVGDGDSGYQILNEISKTDRKVYFSGSTKVQTLPQEILGKTLWWWFTITGFLSFSRKTWIGRKIMRGRQPIIGTDVKKILKRDNVIPVGRTKDGEETIVETEKYTLEDVKNIVWATGYRPNFEWIEGVELTHDGYPKNNRGISSIKNLYFIGLPWLHTRGSATLGGVGKDAKFISKHIQANL